MSKDIILEILNSSYRWELIDIFISAREDHYHRISLLWNESLDSYDYGVNYYTKFFSISAHGVLALFLWSAKRQLEASLVDVPFALHQYTKAYPKGEKSFDMFMDHSRDFLSFYKHINIPFINALQYLHIVKEYLYKSEAFHLSFNERVADYMYNAIISGNVSSEFLSFLSLLGAS